MAAINLNPSQIPQGTLAPVELDGESYVVAHHSKGWCMFLDACTHAPCALSANGEIVEGSILVCNCHGAEYDLVSGDVLELPAEEPLVVHPLRVSNGELQRD